MARIVVCTVVTRDPQRLVRTVVQLRKNAGVAFEHNIADVSGNLTMGAHLDSIATPNLRVHTYGKRLSWAIATNLMLDMLAADPPNFILHVDPDIDVHSRRVVRKMLAVAMETRAVVQPRVIHGYRQQILGQAENWEVVNPPDPRFLLVPWEVYESFRYDHFSALASHDEIRLGSHAVKALQMPCLRLRGLRVKHCGSRYQALSETEPPTPNYEREMAKVMGYAN